LKLKIVQHPGCGVVVIDSVSGNIEGVKSVAFRASVDEIPTVRIELYSHGLEAEGAGEVFMTHPSTGASQRVSRIEFADGSTWDAGVTP
jgi:hypothetical protein